MTTSSHHQTALQIIADQADDLPASVQDSLEAVAGHLSIQIQVLGRELSRRTQDQSAEKLLQALVSIAAIALCGAATHIIPELTEEEA